MKDIRPLVIETDSDEVRALLRSAEFDEPPNGAMRRVLTRAGVGMAIAAATTSTTTASATITASAAKMAPVVIGKWLAVAAVVGAGAMGAVHVARPWTSSMVARQPTANATRVVPEPQAAPVVEAAPAVEPASTAGDLSVAPIAAPVATPSRPRRAAPSASADIVGEISAITLVRGALDKRDARGALAALDRYQQDYPHGALAPEATVLRIEALQLAGERSRAKALGESFLKAHPKSPHAQRVRSLLGPE